MATKRKGARWGSVVQMVPARPRADGRMPRVIVKEQGSRRVVENLDDLEVTDLSPVRVFRSHWTGRRAPQEPFMARMGRHIKVESKTESICALLYDRDPRITHVLPQPFWIERWIGDTGGWSCPDFLLQYDDGTRLVVEVKEGSRGLADRTVRPLIAARDACRRVGLDYQLHMALDVDTRMNFELLHTYSGWRNGVGPGIEELIASLLAETVDPIPLEEVWRLGPEPRVRSVVWWALWHSLLCCDWSRPITERTLVRAHDPVRCAAAKGASDGDFGCGPRIRDRLPEFAPGLRTGDE